MSMLARIAYRNVRRHRRRTLLSGITIAVGLVLFLFTDAMFSSVERGAIDDMIALSVSAVKVHTRSYLAEKESRPLGDGLPDVEAVRAFLARDSRVVATTPRTLFFAQVGNGVEMLPVVGTVVDPEGDPAVFSLPDYTEGRYLTPGQVYEVVLGKSLASDLGVALGDYVTIYARTRNETHNAEEFRVVGLLDTTDPALNRATVVISFETADDFLDLDGLVTEVDVALERPSRFEEYEQAMKEVGSAVVQAFPNLGVETFVDVGAGFLAMVRGKRAFSWVFMGVILLIAAVGIFNSVLMSVYERVREIGVLRAHGLTPREITWMFLLEGFFTGLAGALLGVTVGAVVVCCTVEVGIPIHRVVGQEMTAGIPVWGTLHGQWNPGSFLFAFLFGVSVALVAGWIPSRTAGRMTVTDALRHV